ncbi:MAG: PTS sugar transporter subunit IIA [Erysipelotrichaceae bacterium]
MEEIISLNSILIHQKAGDWKEAISIAGETLVKNGQITEHYIEMMIESVKNLGPYIVLMPRFALAHSAPCKEVLNNCLSIAIFDEDIDFGSDKGPVNVVMVLASTDGESHVAKLSKIAEKLMDEGDSFIKQLIESKSTEEVYELLNN